MFHHDTHDIQEDREDREEESVEDGGEERVNLTFSEVLHLLSKRAVLGQGIPAKYNSPPWRLEDSNPLCHTVNSLLETSMMVQAGHVPNTDNDFQEFVLSNASLAVAGLLRHYLAAAGLEADIVFGVLRWDEAAREGPGDYEGTPHVWLKIGQTPIDNNYVAFPPEADNLEYFYECKKSNAYCEESPLETSLKLYLGLEEDDDAQEVVRHNLRILSAFSQHDNILKYLAICLKHSELNPGVKMYHILMQNWLRSALNISPPDIEETMERICWDCGEEATDLAALKTCTECKVAKYCHR